MRRQFLIVLAVLFLFTGVGLSLHHHEDAAVHKDCQVCAVASHHQSLAPTLGSWAPALSVLFVLSTAFFIHMPVPILSRKRARAPPIF